MIIRYKVAPSGGSAGDVRDVEDSEARFLIKQGLAVEEILQPEQDEDNESEDE